MTDEEVKDYLKQQAAIAAQDSCNSDGCYDFASGRLYDTHGITIYAYIGIGAWFLDYCNSLETKDHDWVEADAEPPYDICQSCGHKRH